MKLQQILWLCLLFTSTTWHAQADMIPAGKRGVNYCVLIDNIDQYPDYVFIAYCQFPTPTYSIIEPGECIQFCHLSQPLICAIAKSKFREDSIKSDGFMTSEKAKQRLQRYFDANPDILRSDVKIGSIFSTDESDPVKSVEDIVTIKSLSDSSLGLVYQCVTYSFTDGTSEKKAYSTQNQRPAHSHKAITPVPTSSGFPDGMWLVAGGIALMGLLLGRYIRNRPN